MSTPAPIPMPAESFSQGKLKRRRVQFSCTACKARKVKCDRGRPFCKVCVARKTTDRCCYPSPDSSDSGVIFHVSKEIGSAPKHNEVVQVQPSPGFLFPSGSSSSHSESNLFSEDGRSSIATTEILGNIPRHTTDDTGLVSEIQMIKDKLRSLEHTIDLKASQAAVSAGRGSNFDRYESDSHSPVAKRKKDIRQRIMNLLFYLKLTPDEKFDIYSGYKPMFYFVSRVNGYGPLAWVALVIKDSFSQPILENILNEKFNTLKVSDIFYQQSLEPSTLDDAELGKIGMNYDEYINSSILPQRKKPIENLTYRDLLEVLPKKRVIWLLFERFFRYVYPFAPYTDYNCCKKQLERVLNTKKERDYNSEEFITVINIKNKLDLSYVGATLVMLKLAYKTLITMSDEALSLSNSDEEIYLRNHPLNDRMIELAKYIIGNYDFMKRCTFPIYQYALLLNFYQKIDGEKLYTQGETHLSSSILVQMAASLGMNRDPSKFANFSCNAICGSLGRKIWHTLVSIDNFQYFQEGVPKSIAESSCDTELPQFDPSFSNNNDPNIEKLTIQLIHTRHEIEAEIKPIADKICDIHNPPTVLSVLESLENFEETLVSRFDYLNTLFKKSNNNTYYNRLEKVGNTLIVFEAISFIFTILLHLGLKFESMKHFPAAKFFSSKILASSMSFLSVIPEIASSSHEFFGVGFDFVVIPSTEIIMCKNMVFITSNYVKYSIFKQKLLKYDPLDAVKLKLINQILHTILYDVFYNRHLKVLKLLASNFFFAWRILKAQSYIFTLLKDGLLSYENQRGAFNFVETYTADDLMETLQLLDLSNYSNPNKPDCYFTSILRKYKADICDEDPRNEELFSNLNLELRRKKDELSNDSTMGRPNICRSLFNNDGKSSDNLFGSIFSVEDDQFWMDILQSNKLNDPQNGIFRILDNLYPSQKGNYQPELIFSDVEETPPLPEVIADPTVVGINDEKDELKNQFVDEAIFDFLF